MLPNVGMSAASSIATSKPWDDMMAFRQVSAVLDGTHWRKLSVSCALPADRLIADAATRDSNCQVSNNIQVVACIISLLTHIPASLMSVRKYAPVHDMISKHGSQP